MKLIGIFLVREIRTGGHVRYLELMEALGREHDILVAFNPLCGYRPRNFKVLEIPLGYDRNGPYPKSAIFASAVRRAFSLGHLSDRRECDGIIVFGETNLPAAAELCRRWGCPLVFAYRSDSVAECEERIREYRRLPLRAAAERMKRLSFRRYESMVARSASRIIFQSAVDEGAYLKRNPKAAGRTDIVRGDICQPRFKPEFSGSNEAERADRLLFIGTTGQRKGLRILLEALGLLERRGVRPTLDVLAEESGEAPLRKLAEKLGIAGRVAFRGRQEPFPYLRQAGLLVVPSVFDSYPNVILEAIHAGCPVIGAKVGGIPEMLGSEELLFGKSDPASLADKLEELIRLSGAYRRARVLCGERRQYFTFDWAAEWTRAIEPALNDRGGGAKPCRA